MYFVRHQNRNFEVNVFPHFVQFSTNYIYKLYTYMYTMKYYSTVLLYPQFLILIIILHVLLISASYYYYYFLYHRHLSSFTHSLSPTEPTAQSPFMPAKPKIYRNNPQPPALPITPRHIQHSPAAHNAMLSHNRV